MIFFQMPCGCVRGYFHVIRGKVEVPNEIDSVVISHCGSTIGKVCMSGYRQEKRSFEGS